MRVLVIDDNTDITDALSLYLETKDIECRVANSGKEGLSAIKSEDYDIIFLDLAMPEFSGYDVFKQLKKDGMLATRNVIIFTASSINEQDVDSLIKEGAKGIMRKPFPVEDLEAIIGRFQKH
jgi:DNA-binding response OmpR family regulator